MSDTRTTRDDSPGRPRQRHGAAWFALVAIAAALVVYFLFFTGRPDDATLTGNQTRAGTPAASVAGSAAPALPAN